MATLFISGTGARVIIASDDHCPPHVLAFHRTEGWIVSFVVPMRPSRLVVLSIAPTGQAMRQRQLNRRSDGPGCLAHRSTTDRSGVLRQCGRCNAHRVPAWRRDDCGNAPRRSDVTRNRITDAEYARAVRRARGAGAVPRRLARYLADCDAIEMLTMRDGGFVVPRRLVGALQDATAAEMTELQVWPDGSMIEIAGRDVHIPVHGLITAALPVCDRRDVRGAGWFRPFEEKDSHSAGERQEGRPPEKARRVTGRTTAPEDGRSVVSTAMAV
jgi:hypothetical protein